VLPGFDAMTRHGWLDHSSSPQKSMDGATSSTPYS
jgi:hypothetical protein